MIGLPRARRGCYRGRDAMAPSVRTRLSALLGTAVATLALDLASKAWAWTELRRVGMYKVIPGVLHLEYAFNTGAAFGMLRDETWARGLFLAITALVVLTLGVLARKLRADPWWVHAAIGLVLGGALGNLHDRLVRVQPLVHRGLRHGVVDFIVVFYWPGRRWPAFNIADVALLVGAIGIAFALRRHAPTR